MLDVFICLYETVLHVKAVNLCAAPDATQGKCNKNRNREVRWMMFENLFWVRRTVSCYLLDSHLLHRWSLLVKMTASRAPAETSAIVYHTSVGLNK